MKNDIQKLEDFNSWIKDTAKYYLTEPNFGTHISKGVHSSSEGDNIVFKSENILPNTLVGSQSLPLEPDVTRNATDMFKVDSFLSIKVNINQQQITLKKLLLIDHPILDKAFSDDSTLSNKYKFIFQESLRGKNLTIPITDERNKQLLWANNEDSIINDDYTCLVPLYPSTFTNIVYNTINQSRYSDKIKKQRKIDIKIRKMKPNNPIFQ